MRVCSQPGCGVLVPKSGYCTSHVRERARARGTRQQRGYDAAHDRMRLEVAKLVAKGQAVCPKCGRPVLPGSEWHLGHTDDRTSWTGAEHAFCNLSAAGKASHAG